MLYFEDFFPCTATTLVNGNSIHCTVEKDLHREWHGAVHEEKRITWVGNYESSPDFSGVLGDLVPFLLVATKLNAQTILLCKCLLQAAIRVLSGATPISQQHRCEERDVLYEASCCKHAICRNCLGVLTVLSAFLRNSSLDASLLISPLNATPGKSIQYCFSCLYDYLDLATFKAVPKAVIVGCASSLVHALASFS